MNTCIRLKYLTKKIVFWHNHCVQTDPAKNAWTCAYLIPERTRTRFLSSLFINRSFNTFRSIQCEQFKEKLSEIRGWGQADRHFAAHYRLFLNERNGSCQNGRTRFREWCYSMMTRFCSKKNSEQTGTKTTEIHSHHYLYCDTTFPQFDDLIKHARENQRK
jgi:hypothetical protein